MHIVHCDIAYQFDLEHAHAIAITWQGPCLLQRGMNGSDQTHELMLLFDHSNLLLQLPQAASPRACRVQT